MNRPDIDVEICPPGTMDAIAFAANELRGLEMFDSEMAAAGICPATPGQIADKLDAILTAHRAQPVVSRESRQATQPDYTSEAEDLTTWPQTRGPEWRRMGANEALRLGDVWRHSGGWYLFANRCCLGLPPTDTKSGEAWTRRPAPEAQP